MGGQVGSYSFHGYSSKSERQERLEFELAYYDVTMQYVSYYVTGIPSNSSYDVYEVYCLDSISQRCSYSPRKLLWVMRKSEIRII